MKVSRELLTASSSVVLAAVGVALLFYVWREVRRDVLIVDPITVPKEWSESGLTPEAMAALVGDRMRQIETSTQTKMKKDQLTMVPDSPPSIELPGTGFTLKTLVDMTRAVLGKYPRRIGGIIVLATTSSSHAKTDSAKPRAGATVFVTEGQKVSPAVSVGFQPGDVDGVVQAMAEAALGQVNPYVMAAYYDEHQQYEQATALAMAIIQNPSTGRRYKAAATILIGNVLTRKGKFDEAIAKYRKAAEIDPRHVNAWFNWGQVLYNEKKYDEAIAKYKRVTEIDPKDADAWYSWGLALDDEKKYDEAIAKYQKVTEINPNYADAWNNWGNALLTEKKYDEAIGQFQKALAINPKYTYAWNNWGWTLYEERKYDEAIAKYQKALAIDPKYTVAWENWGLALKRLGKTAEAEEKFAQARALEGSQ